jgi:PIN domain nuclease of toxin-antitoxin system
MGSFKMKILLDTHIWLWYLFGNEKLSDNLKTILTDAKTSADYSGLT